MITEHPNTNNQLCIDYYIQYSAIVKHQELYVENAFNEVKRHELSWDI